MIDEINPHDASVLLAAGDGVALDIREAWEWEKGHIRDALHIPLGQLAQRLHELPQGRRLIAVCRSGSRSGSVIAPLRQLGYDIVNLAGGLVSWHAHSLPLEPAAGEVA